MDFTGEVWMPGKTPERIERDHIERYRFASGFVEGKSVLDIACGAGYGSRMLAEAGASKVDAVDISKDLVEYARSNYISENIEFVEGDISTFRSNTPYDIVVCFETIEHIDDCEGALSNLYMLLKSSGTLLISSPNRLITSPDTGSFEDRPLNAFHVHEFTVRELSSMLKSRGFEVSNNDVFGQRQQLYFKNRLVSRIYRKICAPDINNSPVVERVKDLMPKYFVIKASKS